MSSTLVDVPKASGVQGTDELAKVAVQTLKPTPAGDEPAPVIHYTTQALIDAQFVGYC